MTWHWSQIRIFGSRFPAALGSYPGYLVDDFTWWRSTGGLVISKVTAIKLHLSVIWNRGKASCAFVWRLFPSPSDGGFAFVIGILMLLLLLLLFCNRCWDWHANSNLQYGGLRQRVLPPI